MTLYARVEFSDRTTFRRLPSHRAFKEAEALGRTPEESYLIEDDGPDHVKVSQGTTSIRVPWSNILAAEPLIVAKGIAPLPLQVPVQPDPVRVAELTLPEPKGLPELPRANKGPGPRKGILR